jgi:hypothetical protein
MLDTEKQSLKTGRLSKATLLPGMAFLRKKLRILSSGLGLNKGRMCLISLIELRI